jgi:hypothetical protein
MLSIRAVYFGLAMVITPEGERYRKKLVERIQCNSNADDCVLPAWAEVQYFAVVVRAQRYRPADSRPASANITATGDDGLRSSAAVRSCFLAKRLPPCAHRDDVG